MGPIDEYVARLECAVHGPRPRRPGILAEARDHLDDAAGAYEESGLDRRAAEAAAVADFGSVGELAPAYRLTLALGQVRRGAVGLLLVLLPQPVLWGTVIPEEPASDSLLLRANLAIERLGLAAMIAAAIVAALCTVGVRRIGVRERWVRACAAAAVGVSGALTALAGLMLAVDPGAGSALVAGIVTVAGFAGMGLLAWRGLRLLREIPPEPLRLE